MNSVSAIITCYNYGKYLDGCIQSVLGQSEPVHEIVIVDDGSTDDTEQVLQHYENRDRITIVRQQNKGQACAKNEGARRASGDLLAFLDADDRWDRHKTELQRPIFADPSIGVVYGQVRYIDEHDVALQLPPAVPELAPRRGNVSASLFIDNFIPFSSAMIRRSLFQAADGFDESLPMGIDWDLWLRLSVVTRFEFVPQPLLIYRAGHAGQMSKNRQTRQECSDRIMAKFLERHPEALPPATVRRAYAYTFVNRAYAARDTSLLTSDRWLLRAVGQQPLWWRPYRELAKNAVLALLPTRWR